MSASAPRWVFAYGSLMWNPGFAVRETEAARLHGFHRAFCIYSEHYRGTPQRPGLILGLLAAEITARTGKDPGQHYQELTAKFGAPCYTRIDAPASPEQKAAFKKLTPEAVTATELAGDKITAKLTKAPGNGAPIGGLKVTTENAWFAARPSGTEDVYKIYAESFRGPDHLAEVQEAAREVVSAALGS